MLGRLIAGTGALVVAAGLGSGIGLVVKHHSLPVPIVALQPTLVAPEPVLDPRLLTDFVPMVCQPASVSGDTKIEPPEVAKAPLPARKRK